MMLVPEKRELVLTPPVRRLMQVVKKGGGDARAVGGAVRDALTGSPIGDIDMAVNLQPEQVMALLDAEDIKTVPTGLAYGTLTAVIDHVGYEITSLRRDIETDGRHAQILYTGDWREDAARRDFTMNALYLDADGALTDYFGGVEDAQAGRVRFIGDARARIHEDVLRILRFFRFYAWFGKGPIDAEGLAACDALAHLLPRLSAERAARETLKLLAAPDPYPAWKLMLDHKIAQAFTAEADHLSRLQHLLQMEKTRHERAPGLTRLAALLPQDKKAAQDVAARLKLSKRDSDALAALIGLPALLHAHLDPMPLRRLIYKFGADNVRAALFLCEEKAGDAFATVAAWENPVLPVRGEDIVRAGIDSGPQVGKVLAGIEEFWISTDFRATRAECLARIPRA